MNECLQQIIKLFNNVGGNFLLVADFSCCCISCSLIFCIIFCTIDHNILLLSEYLSNCFYCYLVVFSRWYVGVGGCLFVFYGQGFALAQRVSVCLCVRNAYNIISIGWKLQCCCRCCCELNCYSRLDWQVKSELNYFNFWHEVKNTTNELKHIMQLPLCE